ncbi:D-glycero-alpha-D-manno-heptose-1,7-bisphosphate 7-phosphatase [Streptomyces cellostaticus]|uniref:D-glycero-alpha-D-manno-heptose-1,7-bisphosphate 7-phosphatase n=1 Tax=Streptomyces cellostaticus TaxID=67285 RepID=UPI0035A84DFE
MTVSGVLLDRDGVLNDPPVSGYVTDPADFRWLPGALSACRLLAAARIPVAIVTNQSAVGRGILTTSVLMEIHSMLQRDVGAVWPIFYCPHVPRDQCACRKPQPTLLHRAAGHLGLPVTDLVFVGDHHTDQQAAHAAGMRFYHVRTGRDSTLARSVTSFSDLAAAVTALLYEREEAGSRVARANLTPGDPTTGRRP